MPRKKKKKLVHSTDVRHDYLITGRPKLIFLRIVRHYQGFLLLRSKLTVGWTWTAKKRLTFSRVLIDTTIHLQLYTFAGRYLSDVVLLLFSSTRSFFIFLTFSNGNKKVVT